MSITLVAKEAGVSHATVSNVINNRPNVDARTAKLVRKAMADIGYTPRPIERRPGRRPRSADGIRSGVVLLIWSQHVGADNAIACGLMEGVSKALGEHGIRLSIVSADESSVDAFAKEVAAADGCLVQGVLPKSLLEPLRKTPVVWLGSHGPTDWGDRVRCDHGQVARDAAAHLKEQGAERLVYLNLDPSHPAFVHRHIEFHGSGSQLGLPVEVFQPRSDLAKSGLEERAADVARQLVDFHSTSVGNHSDASPSPRLGFSVACDRHLAHIDRECRRLGFDFIRSCFTPGVETPIVACDNDTASLSGIIRRPATFEIQPTRIGVLAVERLVERMKNAAEPGQTTTLVSAVFVPPPAVFRETSLRVDSSVAIPWSEITQNVGPVSGPPISS